MNYEFLRIIIGLMLGLSPSDSFVYLTNLKGMEWQGTIPTK